MLRKLIGLAAAACLLAASMTAMAKETEKKKNKNPYVQKRVMIFKGSDIPGSVIGPNGTLIKPDDRYKHPSLIDYRYDFVDRMVVLPNNL